MDWSVPGDSVAVGPQDLVGLLGQRGVFEPGLRKALGDPTVELDVCWRGVWSGVERLVVDDVDGPRSCQLVNELVRPPSRGVQLEAQCRVELEAALQGLGRRGVAQAGRDDEGHGPRLAIERVCERAPSLPKRQVERGALVGPAPVQLLDPEGRRERFERPRAGQRPARACRLLAIVLLRVPGDVLPEPFLPRSGEPDDRGHAVEVARDAGLEPLERVALDLERKLGDPSIHLPGRVTQTLEPTEEESPGVRGSPQRSYYAVCASSYLLPCPFPPLLFGWVFCGASAFFLPLPLAWAPFVALLPLPLAWAPFVALLPLPLVWAPFVAFLPLPLAWAPFLPLLPFALPLPLCLPWCLFLFFAPMLTGVFGGHGWAVSTTKSPWRRCAFNAWVEMLIFTHGCFFE